MKKQNLVTAVLAGILVTGLSGCASTATMDEMRAEIRQANETAQAARDEAAAASRAAAEAKAAAEDAKAMAMETDTKIDRMFKKAMYK